MSGFNIEHATGQLESGALNPADIANAEVSDLDALIKKAKEKKLEISEAAQQIIENQVNNLVTADDETDLAKQAAQEQRDALKASVDLQLELNEEASTDGPVEDEKEEQDAKLAAEGIKGFLQRFENMPVIGTIVGFFSNINSRDIRRGFWNLISSSGFDMFNIKAMADSKLAFLDMQDVKHSGTGVGKNIVVTKIDMQQWKVWQPRLQVLIESGKSLSVLTDEYIHSEFSKNLDGTKEEGETTVDVSDALGKSITVSLQKIVEFGEKNASAPAPAPTPTPTDPSAPPESFLAALSTDQIVDKEVSFGKYKLKVERPNYLIIDGRTYGIFGKTPIGGYNPFNINSIAWDGAKISLDGTVTFAYTPWEAKGDISKEKVLEVLEKLKSTGSYEYTTAENKTIRFKVI